MKKLLGLYPAFLFTLFLNEAIAQQKSAGDIQPVSKQLEIVLKNRAVQESFHLIEAMAPQTRKDHIELTEIPAPPFKEGNRAIRYKELLSEAGADKVWIDSIGNVLTLRKGKVGARTVVMDAHLDTVFPEGTNVTVKVKGDTLFAPGIADDTRSLVAMLTVLRAMEKAKIQTIDNVLFIATVGEEGLGDLRGVKYIVEKSNIKIDSWIAVDGTNIAEIVNTGLGSVRYKVSINGPGGHSWGAFGIGNPHHAMAKAINYFADEAVRFTSTGIKTSFNVGRTGGGTSVNSIPFESWAEVDMRSESPYQLRAIDSIFKASMQKGLSDYNSILKKGPLLTLNITQIGYRPSGATDEKALLVQHTLEAARYFTAKPTLIAQSTNANTPIAHGIPSVCIGAGGKSNKEHSLDEWWVNDKGADGIKFVLLTLLLEAGVAK